MVARTTHTHSALEIDLTRHGYQTRCTGCPRQHLLFVDGHHPAGKMLCVHALLPEWLE
jgi:hypothetical protein